jgi:hypothetical protein
VIALLKVVAFLSTTSFAYILTIAFSHTTSGEDA